MIWQTVQLAEVANIERKGINPSNIEAGTNYLGLEHIESGGDIIGCQKVENGDLASTKFLFGPDHMLYGKLRPYLAKIALPNFEGICSTDILPIKPGPKLDKVFLAYFLRQPSMVDYATSRSTGANLPRLSPKALGAFEIPLPPLKEQKRIAAILDQADALRRLRQYAINKLNVLGQSMFFEMFGDQLKNEIWQPLGPHTSKVGSGATPKGGETAYKSSGISLIRSMNVRDGEFSGKGLAFIDDQQAEKLKNVVVEENDVLLNITGASVARVCIVPKRILPARVNQHVSIIRLKDKILPEFLETFLLFPTTKKKLVNIAESGATRQALTKTEIEELQIPIFPIGDQQKFVSKRARASSQVELYSRQLRGFGNLFSSLQQHAFRGEL